MNPNEEIAPNRKKTNVAKLEIYKAGRSHNKLNHSLESDKNSSKRKNIKEFGKDDIALVTLDAKGFIISWSLGAKKLTGFTLSDVKKKRFSYLFEEDKDNVDILIQLNNDSLDEGSYLFHRKNGEPFQAKVNYTCITDSDAKTIAYTLIIKPENFDAIKRDKQLGLLAEYTDDIVSLHREDGSYVYCSPSVEKTLGYKSDEIIGKSPFDFFYPGKAQKGRVEFEKLYSKKESSEHELLMKHKSGHYIWLEVKVNPIMDEQGKIKYIVASSRDITEKKASAEELKLQKAYFEQLFASSPEGIVILNTAGRIENANQSFQNLFNYSKDELLGLKLHHIIYPDKPSSENVHWANYTEIVWKRKDGRQLDISLIGAPIIYDNRSVGSYVIFRDITFQKSNENYIKQSLLEKEVLLKEIHHRVKNNMQIISGLHNMQAMKIKDKKTQAVFRESQNRVQAMALIHDQLYRSSDLEGLDFADYLRNLIHQLFSSYGRNKITYAIEADPVTISVKQAVPCGLIINELVTNSIKHAFGPGEGGRVQIRLKKNKGPSVLLEVSDNGVGLPDNFDIDKVGTSMGMQLINGLVNQIKGTLTLSSDEETTFSILFTT
ncbi:MAG: PAS domain S-box protein [Balneolales bacterium]